MIDIQNILHYGNFTIAMENGLFKDVFPIENGDIP